MHAKVASTRARLAAVIVMATSLTGCGSNIEGMYAGSGNSFFEKMTIKLDKKVEITFMGMTKEGAYAVDGKNIKITMRGDTQIFTIDDQGCLAGGGPLGKYCKGESGGNRSAGKSMESNAGKSMESGLSGIYRARGATVVGALGLGAAMRDNKSINQQQDNRSDQ